MADVYLIIIVGTGVPSTSISVNGSIIKLSGNEAVADTRTTLIFVPDEVCKALYNAIPRATYDSTQQGYIFPTSIRVEDLPEFKSRGKLALDIFGDAFLKPVYAI
ncbi:hypothetical protein FOXB_17777 [Fusarium oxysporum f. sp. conglutinans Fo5176]|uniref:Peptidase A1 domain-containing protein n=1 Tax=Fusarium oxysporum (strain Fo5176) TaxID=660025 RepID=F9GGJ3_FUSOF|nr:hypothetical protein FOXB_17777 [Fusarium oxysporum f. sp. conglutinans Fo5176]